MDGNYWCNNSKTYTARLKEKNPAVLSIEPRDPYFMDYNPQIRYNCVVFHPLYHKTPRNPCFIAQYGIIQWSIKTGQLVGGLNRCEKYESNWIISPGRVKNKKCFKPPASRLLCILWSSEENWCHLGQGFTSPIKIKHFPQSWALNRSL